MDGKHKLRSQKSSVIVIDGEDVPALSSKEVKKKGRGRKKRENTDTEDERLNKALLDAGIDQSEISEFSLSHKRNMVKMMKESMCSYKEEESRRNDAASPIDGDDKTDASAAATDETTSLSNSTCVYNQCDEDSSQESQLIAASTSHKLGNRKQCVASKSGESAVMQNKVRINWSHDTIDVLDEVNDPQTYQQTCLPRTRRNHKSKESSGHDVMNKGHTGIKETSDTPNNLASVGTTDCNAVPGLTSKSENCRPSLLKQKDPPGKPLASECGKVLCEAVVHCEDEQDDDEDDDETQPLSPVFGSNLKINDDDDDDDDDETQQLSPTINCHQQNDDNVDDNDDDDNNHDSDDDETQPLSPLIDSPHADKNCNAHSPCDEHNNQAKNAAALKRKRDAEDWHHSCKRVAIESRCGYCMFDGVDQLSAQSCETSYLSQDRLISKKRCERSLSDRRPPLHCPPNMTADQFAHKLCIYSEQLKLLIQQTQSAQLDSLPWGGPVIAGRHMDYTIDLRVRGQRSYKWPMNFDDIASDDEDFENYQSNNSQKQKCVTVNASKGLTENQRCSSEEKRRGCSSMTYAAETQLPDGTDSQEGRQPPYHLPKSRRKLILTASNDPEVIPESDEEDIEVNEDIEVPENITARNSSETQGNAKKSCDVWLTKSPHQKPALTYTRRKKSKEKAVVVGQSLVASKHGEKDSNCEAQSCEKQLMRKNGRELSGRKVLCDDAASNHPHQAKHISPCDSKNDLGDYGNNDFDEEDNQDVTLASTVSTSHMTGAKQRNNAIDLRHKRYQSHEVSTEADDEDADHSIYIKSSKHHAFDERRPEEEADVAIETIQCPMCFSSFPAPEIAEHASGCDGKVPSASTQLSPARSVGETDEAARLPPLQAYQQTLSQGDFQEDPLSDIVSEKEEAESSGRRETCPMCEEAVPADSFMFHVTRCVDVAEIKQSKTPRVTRRREHGARTQDPDAHRCGHEDDEPETSRQQVTPDQAQKKSTDNKHNGPYERVNPPPKKKACAGFHSEHSPKQSEEDPIICVSDTEENDSPAESSASGDFRRISHLGDMGFDFKNQFKKAKGSVTPAVDNQKRKSLSVIPKAQPKKRQKRMK